MHLLKTKAVPSDSRALAPSSSIILHGRILPPARANLLPQLGMTFKRVAACVDDGNPQPRHG